jgi:DNA-binding transcriptional LysR family regulator
MLSLNQLRAFLEVAQRGSVAGAADALIVSQPAVSAALAALGREVGARLVERDGRKLRLTPAGRSLETYGRRIFALIDDARRSARELDAAAARHFAIAAVTTAAEFLVPDLLQRFLDRQAGVDVELDVGNHTHVWDRLRRWEADVVIAGRPPAEHPFRTLATRKHEMIVIGPPRSANENVDLARATWLVREPGSGTRAVTEECFAALGIDPPQLTITSNGAIGACVRAGLGFSIVSRDGFREELRDGSVVHIPTPITPLDRRWHLVAASDRELRDVVREFIDFAIHAGGFEATQVPLPA